MRLWFYMIELEDKRQCCWREEIMMLKIRNNNAGDKKLWCWRLGKNDAEDKK